MFSGKKNKMDFKQGDTIKILVLNKMRFYEIFKTEEFIEISGIFLDYDGIVVKLKKLRPHDMIYDNVFIDKNMIFKCILIKVVLSEKTKNMELYGEY